MTDENQKISWDFIQQILDVLREIAEMLKNYAGTANINSITEDRQVVVKTPWHNTVNHVPTDGEKNTKPSKTIPDQSLSIREIMLRYARGLPLEGVREPFFDEDPDNPMPDLSRMDIIDQHETIQAAKDEIRDIAHKYRTEQEEKKQKAYNEYKAKYEELDKKYKEDIKQGNLKFNPADQGSKDPAK